MYRVSVKLKKYASSFFFRDCLYSSSLTASKTFSWSKADNLDSLGEFDWGLVPCKDRERGVVRDIPVWESKECREIFPTPPTAPPAAAPPSDDNDDEFLLLPPETRTSKWLTDKLRERKSSTREGERWWPEWEELTKMRFVTIYSISISTSV